jgi:hypothetical protein
MMPDPMTVPQAEKWLRSLENPGRYGWVPEHKKIGRHLRDQHKRRLTRHVTADGAPWPKKYHKPRPKVGDTVPMLVDGEGGGRARVVVQTIRSVAGRRKAVAFRNRFGPPMKPLPALVRKTGKRKARKIWDFLVGRGFAGGALQIGRTFLKYGWTRGTRWIEKLQYGGTYRRKRVPPRGIVGLNRADIRFIDETYAAGFEKRAMKGKR